jgi:hypothetical protein
MVTFIVIGIGIGFEAALCRLLFGVHALPVGVGIASGLAAYHGGAGEIALIVVTPIAGVLTLVAGWSAMKTFRSPVIRTATALLFVVPAVWMGYGVTLGLAQWLDVPSVVWQQVYALFGAVVVGGTALERLTDPNLFDSEW